MANNRRNEKQDFDAQDQFEERVIEIARVAKVVKGGRRFQFRVTVVVGDKKGTISMGVGKANAVPDAMRKASERARKNMNVINLSGTTIPHEVLGRVAGARVMLKPASPGTGVIAAGGVRAVIEAAGIRDILTKSQGSANVLNVVQATFDALSQLKSPQEEAARRGKNVKDLLPFWERRKQNA
ncbi:MAG TPA: 30S ribosomal protein S5 [Anaerolineales bacterium]|nr:30S ribosomal protein S5 [Anaerolineales bacterium]